MNALLFKKKFGGGNQLKENERATLNKLTEQVTHCYF